MRVSGAKVEKNEKGEYELTYFGVFPQSIPSQTLNIRSKADIDYIIKKLKEARDAE
jgi:hypothetical protein